MPVFSQVPAEHIMHLLTTVYFVALVVIAFKLDSVLDFYDSKLYCSKQAGNPPDIFHHSKL